MTKMWLKTIGLYQAIAISFVCQINKKTRLLRCVLSTVLSRL